VSEGHFHFHSPPHPFSSSPPFFCFSLEKKRTGPDSPIPLPQTVATKPYDWTYTTTYAGSPDDDDDDAGSENLNPNPNVQWVPAESSTTNAQQHAIPIAELSRPDPILFYAEIPLFEDELHDNGASHLLVRIVRLLDPNRTPFSFFVNVMGT
jgi:hypothetical protein